MDEWLAVVLPGRGYGPLGATIRFPCLLLESLGARIAVIDYPVAVSEPVALEEVARASRVQLESILNAVSPQRVTFISKSLGGAVLSSLNSDACRAARVEAIWLTPLFNDALVRSGAIKLGWRSLLVAGTADPYHDPDGFNVVRSALSGESLIVPGANHSLEVPKDPKATLSALHDLIAAVRSFLTS